MRTPTIRRILSCFSLHLERLPDSFERQRLQSPKTVLCTLLAMVLDRGCTSTRRGLQLVRELFPHGSARRQEPSPAAFCKARAKVSADSLRSIFNDLSHHLEGRNRQQNQRVNGLQLIAIDGSQVNLPRTKQTLCDFGTYAHNTNSFQPQSRLVVAWDVLGRKPIDWVLGTCFESERDAARSMIPRIPEKSLVLLDRGFHGIQTIQAFTDAHIACFMRIRLGKTAWLPVRKFVQSRAKDSIVTVQGTIDGELQTFTGRMIKARQPNRTNGRTETVVFMTNVYDTKKWPRRLLLKLYQHRWHIETAYRELKINDRIEQFHTRTSQGIRQEITAFMIARLLAGTLIRCVDAIINGNTKNAWLDERRKRINHVCAMDVTRDILLNVMIGDFENAYENMKIGIIAMIDSAQKQRPGRSYIRKCHGRYGRWKHTKNDRAQRGRNSQLNRLS